MTRVGILGGTFDPIHVGHLIIAEEARCRLQLDKVVFIPASVPPHKPNEPVSDKEHRYNMTVLATEDNPGFEVSRMEFERPGPSYTLDTVRELRSNYGEEAELFFIVGVDSILEIPTWHEPDELVKLCKFVAAARPGYDMTGAERVLPREYLDRIVFLETPEVNISSTQLREMVAQGKSIMYLVPKPVQDYIMNNGLYK